MKPDDLRQRTDDELGILAGELRREHFLARIRNHTNQLESTAKLGQLRKDIARVATVLRQRELSAKGGMQ